MNGRDLKLYIDEVLVMNLVLKGLTSLFIKTVLATGSMNQLLAAKY